MVEDTALYYCNTRYYNPKWRRFISPDDTAYLDPESANGLNLYCYCGKDPVNYCDPSGHAIETPLDLISLGVGVVDVLANPYDPLTWLGLIGDVVDLIPCVTGVGDSVRMVKLSVSLGTHKSLRFSMFPINDSLPNDAGQGDFALLDILNIGDYNGIGRK